MRRILTALFIAIIAFASTANAKITEKTIAYADGKTKLSGKLYSDETVSATRPGIVIYPEWWGQNEYIKGRASQLAAKGYVVFLADMYGDGKATAKADDAKAWSAPFYSDRKLMQSRAEAAVKTLKAQVIVKKSDIALIGFCFGGTNALELARAGADVKAVAGFHAGLDFPTAPEKGAVKARVLVMNGGADPMVPFEQRKKFVDDMQNANADLEFIEYGGAVHAFTNPHADSYGIPGVAYNKRAEERSFKQLDSFLKETLGQ